MYSIQFSELPKITLSSISFLQQLTQLIQRGDYVRDYQLITDINNQILITKWMILTCDLSCPYCFSGSHKPGKHNIRCQKPDWSKFSRRKIFITGSHSFERAIKAQVFNSTNGRKENIHS